MQANKHKHKKVNKEIQILSLNTEAEQINKHIINTDSTRNQSSNILMAIIKDIFILKEDKDPKEGQQLALISIHRQQIDAELDGVGRSI